ncbi:MAG TPA: hypothetical protein VHX52_01275 [Steroidobacteraceae bacterium]|jgi:hypothetical protein|nr:hypothetical protein [Steroidobacteraceae bacterium]
MRTLTLRSMQQPSYLDTLLYSIVMQLSILPADAYPIREPDKLPAGLRQIARMATHVGQSWGCWTDGRDRHWLFVAEMPLTRGKPLLELNRYDEAGDIRDTSNWYCDDNDQWLRCALP